MAHAVALAQRESLQITETGYDVTYAVTFAGADVQGGQLSTGTSIHFDHGDDNATLRAKLRRGVQQAAEESGTNVESVQGDVLITA